MLNKAVLFVLSNIPIYWCLCIFLGGARLHPWLRSSCIPGANPNQWSNINSFFFRCFQNAHIPWAGLVWELGHSIKNRGIPVAVRLFLGIIAGCHSSHIFVSPGTEGGKPVYFHWAVIGARITSAPFNIRILALSGNSRCKNPSRKKELSPGQNRRCGLWNNELLLFPDGQKP